MGMALEDDATVILLECIHETRVTQHSVAFHRVWEQQFATFHMHFENVAL